MNIRDTDFTEDRLGIALIHLSKAKFWQAIKNDLGHRPIRVYDLEAECVRVDAPTVSGKHGESKDRLFQFGHSKDDASLRQIKVMQASLDPLGMPFATYMMSGERADDGW